MDKLGISLGFLLFQIFNFAILCILLYAWAYKPILKMLEIRKQRIAQGLEDARIASEARENAEQEATHILAEAQSKASKLIREATDRAEVAALEIRAAAEAEALDAAKVHSAVAAADTGQATPVPPSPQ